MLKFSMEYFDMSDVPMAVLNMISFKASITSEVGSTQLMAPKERSCQQLLSSYFTRARLHAS